MAGEGWVVIRTLSRVRGPAALLVVGALAWLVSASGRGQSMPLENLDHFPQASLTIRSQHHVWHFTVWVADTPSRQVQGLMFVRDLPAHQGMIFPMRPARIAQFWMANTYIPLDMLFVAPDGRIEKIAANATPFSLKTISSGSPVEAVIEIQGGLARKLGVEVGARISWKKPSRVTAG